MKLLMFFLSGLFVLAGLVLIFAIVFDAPFAAFAKGSVLGSIGWALIGFIVFLLGAWLMRRV